MQSSRSTDLTKPDPKIDRTNHRLLKEKREREVAMATNNVEKKALRDYIILYLFGETSCKGRPMINANNFDLKIVVI